MRERQIKKIENQPLMDRSSFDPNYDEIDWSFTRNKAKKRREESSRDRGFAFHEYDSGLVPDLHSQDHADYWRKMGGEYIDGVGPKFRNPQEEIDFCELTGQYPKECVRIEKRPCKRGAFGYESIRTRRVKVVSPIDRSATMGVKRRSDMHEERYRWERCEREHYRELTQAKERHEQERKRFFFMG